MSDLEIILERLDQIEGVTNTIQYIVGGICLVILVIAFKAFTALTESKVKSYFIQSLEKFKSKLNNELGKNLLDKQAELKKEITILQSELSFASNFAVTGLSDARRALVNFYTSYCFWLNSIDPSKVSVLSDEDRSKTQIYMEEVDNKKISCDAALAELELYVSDTDFLKKMHELVGETLKFKHQLDAITSELLEMATTYKNIRRTAPIATPKDYYEQISNKKKVLREEFLRGYKETLKHKEGSRIMIVEKINKLSENRIK